MTLTDCMSQEKETEEDLSALMQQYNYLKLHKKAWGKTDYSYEKQYKQLEGHHNEKKLEQKICMRKYLYEYFKRQTSKISHEEAWTWLMETLKRNCVPSNGSKKTT